MIQIIIRKWALISSYEVVLRGEGLPSDVPGAAMPQDITMGEGLSLDDAEKVAGFSVAGNTVYMRRTSEYTEYVLD